MDNLREQTVRDKRNVRSWLFNPFLYIAGGNALLLGIVGILLAGFVASPGLVHFDGVLDVHSGLKAPAWIFLAEGMIDWISLAVFIYLIGKIFSRSRVRAIDVFGTQALARSPMIITAAALLMPGYQRFVQHLAARYIKTFPDVETLPADPLVFTAAALVTFAMIFWMVALMYRGFSISCNLRGGKAAGLFVAALLLGEALSKILIHVLFKTTIGLPSFPRIVS